VTLPPSSSVLSTGFDVIVDAQAATTQATCRSSEARIRSLAEVYGLAANDGISRQSATGAAAASATAEHVPGSHHGTVALRLVGLDM
jgi:hypothetical protein